MREFNFRNTTIDEVEDERESAQITPKIRDKNKMMKSSTIERTKERISLNTLILRPDLIQKFNKIKNNRTQIIGKFSKGSKPIERQMRSLRE